MAVLGLCENGLIDSIVPTKLGEVNTVTNLTTRVVVSGQIKFPTLE